MINDGDALELELRQAAQLFDPVPEHLVADAIAAFELRAIDAELAELIFESSLELDAALVRGPDQQPRLLTFQARSLTVELEVLNRGRVRQIVGRVTPAPLEIAYWQGGRESLVHLDDLGRFIIGSVGAGPMRLLCRPVDEGASRPVVTDWFLA